MQQDIIIRFDKEQPINVKVENQKEITPNLEEKINVITSQNHKDLLGLDFESSGHTGFASEKQLNLLKDSTVPKRLNMLQDLDVKANKDKVYLYADNNGVDSKVSINSMLKAFIRKDIEVPVDMQPGEYLFLEQKEEL